MVEFKEILGDVEFVSESVSGRASHDVLSLPLSIPYALKNIASTDPAGARARLANDLYVYSETDTDRRSAWTNLQNSDGDFRELIARLSDRAFSRQELGALRREAARRFHPDRSSEKIEATGAMAELNARIDELIAKTKSRRTEKRGDSAR